MGDLSADAVAWLVDGEHGLSSRCMFNRIVLRRDGRIERPWDMDDFRRCELLRREVPEVAAGLAQMASLSPLWARLVEHWDEIVALAEADCPTFFDRDRSLVGRAPRAWALMQQIEEEPRP